MVEVVYWISTALLSLLYLASASLYLTRREWAAQAIVDLGYPAYLVPILIAAKILGIAAIVSRFSIPLSDLAYAGIFFHLLLSAAAHFGVRKPSGAVPALVGLLLAAASFLTQNGARNLLSPYAPIFGL